MRPETTVSWSSVRLRDGRRLSYCEAGPRRGLPVLYLHGAIGAPVESSIAFEAALHGLGVRWLAVHRPGFGGSDRKPGRSVLGFANDVRQLTDAVGYERFAVLGVSAGGPYALAVARELPERVVRVAACSSLSPLCPPHATPGSPLSLRVGLTLLARAPESCARLGDRILPLFARHPDLLGRAIALGASRADHVQLCAPAQRLAASESFLHAATGGVRGMVDDYSTYARPWDFLAQEVAAEVHLWHGVADRIVPIDHALALAASLPRCRAFLDPDEGHHFFRRRYGDILRYLSGRDPDTAGPEEALGARLVVRRPSCAASAPGR
jgi:pimeloyl-ACP methyl ester carboxylesterase